MPATTKDRTVVSSAVTSSAPATTTSFVLPDTRLPDGPAGLTAREVEVLRLVASGLSNKEIATRLVITPKTAGNCYRPEHIYTKIGTSNRASARLFAMQHGLLPEDGFPDTVGA